jgi:YesN/AraC family two-component response regulator
MINVMDNISVVILDDDILARNTLKSLLENTKYEVIKEFKDPETFLKWIQKNDLDLLLCDMRMPKLNGLELIERVRISHKYLSIIAISSFDDFEFARGCLIYGVEDYLLKSNLNKKILLSVLNRVCKKNQIISKNQENLTNLFGENEILTLENVNKRVNIDFNSNCVVPILLTLSYPIIETNNFSSYRKENFQTLIDIINQTLLNNYPYVLQLEDNNIVTTYLSFSKGNDISSLIERIKKSFIEKVQRKANRLLELKVIVAEDGTSNFESCYKKRFCRLDKMQDFLYLKEDENRISLNLKNTKQTQIEGYVFKEQSIGILKYSIESGNEDLLNNVFDLIFSDMFTRRISLNALKEISKKMLELTDKDKNIIVPQIDNIINFVNYIKDIFGTNLQKRVEEQKQNYPPAIFQLMMYLKKNYKEDYSLFQYAQTMNLSYTHLSRMFKNETGLRFSEYANVIKVNHAKLLLLEEKHSIKYISEQTGFKGYNYFFKVFKDIEGLTPIEYKAKNCSN